MMPARIEVDFIPQRRSLSVPGVVFLLVGLAGALWVFNDLRDVQVSSDVIDLKLARYDARSLTTDVERVVVDNAEVQGAERQLLTPWSRLLEDFELAAKDSGKNVALLEIAPDKEKASVRVTGEARSMQHVLDYLERLQKAESLLTPLLESHEVQTSDQERPVRFIVLANWRVAQ